jgi:hypothetical protein
VAAVESVALVVASVPQARAVSPERQRRSKRKRPLQAAREIGETMATMKWGKWGVTNGIKCDVAKGQTE